MTKIYIVNVQSPWLKRFHGDIIVVDLFPTMRTYPVTANIC